MLKRKNGEGSWGRKTIHGISYIYFRDADGHYTYGKTTNEVKEKLKTITHKIKSSNKITLGEYTYNWLYQKKYLEVGVSLRPSTFDGYERLLKNQLWDYKIYPLTDRQLESLTIDMFRQYLRALATKYSRATITKIWAVIKMSLTDDEATDFNRIPKINLNKIKLPSEANVAVKKRQVNFTTNEDMDKLYNEAYRKRGNIYYYGDAARIVVFIMYTGVRLSEAIGLKWESVDLKNQLITIINTRTKIRKRNYSGQFIGEYETVDSLPKSNDSIRQIPYRIRAGEVLKQMNLLNPQHKKDDYVFQTKGGKPYSRRNVERVFKQMLSRAGCSTQDYSVHSLRHGYGSILYQEGIDIKTISELLGHSDISVTANIYLTTTTDTMRKALNKIDNIS